MQKDTVILFFPRPWPVPTSYNRAPLSLLAIARMFDSSFKIRIIDERLSGNVQKEVEQYLPEAICLGISSFSGFQISGGINISQYIRRRQPNLPIIWGGWHPSLMPEQTVADSLVDVVVKGQGEYTFREVVQAIRNKFPLESIKGIYFKKENKIISTPARPFENVNNFPEMNYALVPVERYIFIRPELNNAKAISYLSSQGCVFRCGFCAEMSVFKRKWSGLKSERVLSEIEKLINKYEINSIYFEDSNFFIDKERVRRICEGFINRKLNITWEGMGHPRQLARYEDGFYELLYESGCRRMLVGAESGSEKVLRFINKDATVQDIIEYVKKLKKHKITPILSTMTGIPGMPEGEFSLTIRMLSRLKEFDEDMDMKIFIYTPYPGSPLYEEAKRRGFCEPKRLQDWIPHTLRKFRSPWLTKKQLCLLQYFCTFYFRFAYSDIKRGSLLSRLIKKLLQYICLTRIKFNFFKLPIDYYSYRIIARLLDKLKIKKFDFSDDYL